MGVVWCACMCVRAYVRGCACARRLLCVRKAQATNKPFPHYFLFPDTMSLCSKPGVHARRRDCFVIRVDVFFRFLAIRAAAAAVVVAVRCRCLPLPPPLSLASLASALHPFPFLRASFPFLSFPFRSFPFLALPFLSFPPVARGYVCSRRLTALTFLPLLQLLCIPLFPYIFPFLLPSPVNFFHLKSTHNKSAMRDLQ